jgi:hypothetical protein
MVRRLLRRGGGNDNIPAGMPIRTQVGMIGSSPQNSAFLAMKQANEQQASLASAVGGSNRRYKYKKGGATTGNVNVPVFASMPYTPNGGPGNTPNDLIVKNSISGTQGAANAKLDQGAFDVQKAGRKSRKTKTKTRKTKRTKITKSRTKRTKSRTKTRKTKTKRTKSRKTRKTRK